MSPRSVPFLYAIGLLMIGAVTVLAQTGRTVSEILAGRTDWKDPVQRAQAVTEMQQAELQRKQVAVAEATRRGLPSRIVRRGGRVEELVDWQDGQLLYLTTENVNAAISMGANLLRNPPYSLNGSGVTVGIWDEGAVRNTHQEFGGRVTVRDGSAAEDHATHVGGTLAAAGVNASARGMASLALLDSYDWDSDVSEMTARGAITATDATKLFLSNHSYAYVVGWNHVELPDRTWEWNGNGSAAGEYEEDFGRYHSIVRDMDSLAYNAPYYLIFRGAGNERTDNPSNGQHVLVGGSIVNYSSAAHPAGDGNYRGGFDTIGFNALAKNVITVGSVTDAVTAGVRNPAAAALSSFSSWGPTDDGRIKPDVVANGQDLFSSLAGSDSAYGTYSGTSMSTPNAAGSAALAIELYRRLFPGQAMRAATLKALLIHTADDLGNPGPDYKFGWGLVNVKRAADLIQAAHDVPDRPGMVENEVSTTVTTRTHYFGWDGVSPLRATLCWTDPAGAATTTNDSRTPRLANNLNLTIVAPGGAILLPYVMPFVGTWTQASMNLAATTGTNNTDNVEQVSVTTPPGAGTYQAIVSYTGGLTNTLQRYSLVLSGTASAGPVPPAPVSITPDYAESGVTALTIAGTNFHPGATVALRLAGHPDVLPAVTAVASTSINCTVNATGMASGLWSVVVTNPDSQTGLLPTAFGVAGTLWSRNFDAGGAPGWTSNATPGVSAWSLTNTASHSPGTSWFASGPVTKNTDNLVSEEIDIPNTASRLLLKFWHRFNFESNIDGGVLELSINGGNYFRVTNDGTSESFVQGGYNTTLAATPGSLLTRNQFALQPAWSGNSGAAFTGVIVSLTDTAKYAGTTLRARWRLGTNNTVASPGGWNVDSVSLTGVGGVINQPPSIQTAAAVNVTPVTGSHAQLSVTAGDDGGAAGLTYTWTYAGGTFDRPVTFSDNGTNAARNITATFAVAGTYNFMVTVRDAAGATAASSVAVTVLSTPSSVAVSPMNVSLVVGAVRMFSAGVLDQFGDSSSPEFTWSVSGGGTISFTGLFRATAAGGPFTVTATAGALSGQTLVTVTKAPASVALSSLTHVYDGTPKPVAVTTTPSGLPVEIHYNGAALAPFDYGAYAVTALITDPNFAGEATGTLRITGIPIASWKSSHFTPGQIANGTSADQADPDFDGYDNLAEYARGTDPNIPSAPVTGLLDANGLSLSFIRPRELPDVLYIGEAGSDLTQWNPLTPEITPAGSMETVRFRDPAAPPPLRRYLRVRFVRPD